MNYYFELRDGKAAFAIAKTQINKEILIGINEETGEQITKAVQETLYLFDADSLSQYPDADPLPKPTPEMLSRAEQIQGLTLSKSEFEQLLFGKTAEEQLQETLGTMGQELAEEKIKNIQKDAVIQALGQELASIKLEWIQRKGGAS
ncbi:hypothetical protein [Brevibacillus sp. NRS-1366]|uniref:hypothetical protein n=1 Tax=Brevibacillus sp. NRS-1366 TaxID=3233899 RepID=UPI003D1FF9E5